MPIIIGIAVISTNDITYDSFLLSPWIAPAVAMAADTPQIDTALEIISDISLSIFMRRQSQNAKYHTDRTTTTACIKPNDPALTISPNITAVPRITRPIFTNSSVDRVSLNHVGSLNVFPINNPSDRLNITASRFNAFTSLLPASIIATMEMMYTIGKTTRKYLSGFAVSNAPISAIIRTNKSWITTFMIFA